MRGRPQPLQIVLELGPTLDGLAGLMDEELVLALEGRLQDLVEALGWPGRIRFKVKDSTSSRAVRVRVGQQVVPYSPLLMRRVWMISVSPPLRLAFANGKSTNRFPDEWLTEQGERARNAQTQSATPLWAFLHRLVIEVVRASPEVLVDSVGAQHYAELGDGIQLIEKIGLEDFVAILRALLELGLSLGRRSRVIGAIADANREGLTAAEIVENVFNRLGPSIIEFRAHPDLTRSLSASASRDESIAVLSALVDGVFDRFGVNLPRIEWTPAHTLAPGQVAVKLNDRISVPVQGVPGGCVLVYDGVEGPPTIQAVPALHPTTGKAAWVVPAATVPPGFKASMTPLEFASSLLEFEITSRLGWLLRMSDVEYHLVRLAEAFPELVRVALTRLSVEELTRILRTMLGERVPIRDLRGILNRLLELDDGQSTADYVREVRRAIVAQCWERWSLGPEGLAVVQATTWAPDRTFDEAFSEAVRDTFFARTFGHTEGPVVVPAPTRTILRQILAAELPEVSVVAQDELPPHIALRVIDVVNTNPQVPPP